MINCVFGNGLHVFYGMLIDLQYDLGNSPLSWDTHPTLKKRDTIFVGRNDKLEEFEQRIDDFNTNKPKTIIASGVPNIGRRTFLRNAFIKTSINPPSYIPLSIYLDRNDSIEDFIIKLNDLSLIDVDDELHNLLYKTIEDKLSIASKIIVAAQKANEIILILDDGCLVNYKRELSDWFRRLILDKMISFIPVLCCASKYRVKLSEKKIDFAAFFLDINELSTSERKRLFGKLLKLLDIDMKPDDFQLFSEQLYGYPDQVLFAVDLIDILKIEGAKKEIHQITEFNSEKAHILLQKHENDQKVFSFIRLLAQFEIISRDFIYEIVDFDKSYYSILEELEAEHICEYIGSEGEFIRLNDMIRDYIKRNQVYITNKFKKKIKAHVTNFLKDDDKLGRDSSDYIYSIKEALAGNHEIDEGHLIPSHFLRCMKELYQKRGKLDRVIQLANKILEKEDYIDKSFIQDVRYYLCLALARKKDNRLLSEVQKIHGDEHNFLLGFYYRLVGRHSDAIEKLTKIIDAPYVSNRARRELVQVLMQIENYEEALEFAKENYDKNRLSHFHIQAYFHCLISSPHYEDYEDELSCLYKELEEIDSDQAKQMALIAKARYIAKIDKNETKSLNIINDGIHMYPDAPYPIFAKFDIALFFKNLQEMVHAHELTKNIKKRMTLSERTVSKQKAYILARQGKGHEALRVFHGTIKEFPEEIKNEILERFKQGILTI